MTWQIASFAVLAIVLVAAFLWYERSRPPARVVALVAALVALAVVGRLAFAAVPNVKPVTDIVLFAGYALGAVPGFIVGALTALVSNIFFGQGPWTAWQMVAWGGVGVGGAVFARFVRGEPGRVQLALACGLAGLAFGAFMDVYQWTLAARQDLATYFTVSSLSASYNAAHVIGNVAFSMLIGPAFIRALQRFRRRFEVTWEPPARAAVAACVAALAVAGGLAGAPAADAASPSAKAAAYLKRAQNKDGGFGGVARTRSSQLFSGWVALGLASAKKHPADVHRRGGRSLLGYVSKGSRSLKDVGELQRTILVVVAAGKKPRSFKGRDLIAEMLRHKRANGSFDNFVSYTSFGILALRAAGEKPGASSVSWLERVQHADGGFSLSPQGRSDADMTGAAIQALVAAGRGGGSTVKKAVAYLRSSQNSDGGYGQFGPTGSNAQSTAYAALGLVAAGAPGSTLDRALGYLRGLQRGDGSVRYSRGSSQTPVWVTAQALMAFQKKALPYRAVKRKKRKRRKAKRSADAAAVASPGDSGGGGGPGKAGDEGGSKSGVESARSASPASPSPQPAPGSASKPASATSEDGVSPWLYGGAAFAALAIVFGVRRFLRTGRDGGAAPTTWS